MNNNTDFKQQLVNHPDYIKTLKEQMTIPAVHVALTGMCNFNCTYCSTSKYKKKPVLMTLPLVKRIIRDCREWKINPWFGQTYEPFLHPNIDTIVQLVNDAGFRFTGSTNGSMLDKQNLYDLPMNLVISISENPNDYKYRSSAVNYDDYKTAIKAFVKYRIGNAVPGTLCFQFADYHILQTPDTVYHKEIVSIKEITKKMKRFSRFLGYDFKLNMDDVNESIQKRQPIEILRSKESALSFVSTKITPSTYEAFSDSSEKVEAGYCDSCFVIMSIQADGGIAYCCCDPTAKTVFHRMTPDEHLKDIWFGSKLEHIRKCFFKRQPVNSFCRQCLYPVSENIKPILTTIRNDVVASILNGYGVYEDQEWFEFN